MVTISVVIPSRNDGPMLAVCLRALARQTRPADEVIVVDGGSTDHTAAVCAAAGVLRIASDRPGIPAATARGFDAAQGDLIARLDADSVPAPDWLERVEADLLQAGPLSAVTGPGEFYGGHPVICWMARTLYIGGYFRVVGWLFGHPPLFGSNFALQRQVWDRLRSAVHRDNPRVHDDFDISYQLRPDMAVVYDPLLRVRVSARPLTSWRALGRRLAMTWTTCRVDFAQEAPLRRRAERRQWAREHGGSPGSPRR